MTTEQRIKQIEREHRHAMATRPTETDSWLNGYRDDVGFLLAERENALRAMVAVVDSKAKAAGIPDA
jgi:hypothetical protein